MRKLILFVLMAAMALPVGAAKRVTVAQLEQLLTGGDGAHRADDALAFQIAVLELSERLTPATLGRIEAKLILGPHATLALHLLSEQSTFLDPRRVNCPQRLLPTSPPKSASSTRRAPMLFRLCRICPILSPPEPHTASTTVPRFWWRTAGLPAPVCTRWVHRRRRLLSARTGSFQPRMHRQARAQPAPRNLTRNSASKRWAVSSALCWLWSSSDTDKGTLAFHHWEQGSASQIAVYRYSVPKSASHYILNYCCLHDQSTMSRGGGGGRRGGGGGGQVLNQPDADAEPYLAKSGYHGSLSIDPATGIILRITLEADLNDRGPLP